MTTPSDRERPGGGDVDDYDVLTFGEVGVRLRRAIDDQRKLVDDLSDADPDALEHARLRLDALIAAAARNRPGGATFAR